MTVTCPPAIKIMAIPNCKPQNGIRFPVQYSEIVAKVPAVKSRMGGAIITHSSNRVTGIRESNSQMK